MGEKYIQYDSDTIGNQMGKAVEKLFPQLPGLEFLAGKIEKKFPKSVARVVAVLLYNHDLLPDHGDPSQTYVNIIHFFAQDYLKTYGEAKEINTLLMPGIGEDIVVHSRVYREGDEERPLYWNAHVVWARDILEHGQVEGVSRKQIIEAGAVLEIQQQLKDTVALFEPYFHKYHLPIPSFSPPPEQK